MNAFQHLCKMTVASILGILMAPAFLIIAIVIKFQLAPKANTKQVYLPA